MGYRSNYAHAGRMDVADPYADDVADDASDAVQLPPTSTEVVPDGVDVAPKPAPKKVAPKKVAPKKAVK